RAPGVGSRGPPGRARPRRGRGARRDAGVAVLAGVGPVLAGARLLPGRPLRARRVPARHPAGPAVRADRPARPRGRLEPPAVAGRVTGAPASAPGPPPVPLRTPRARRTMGPGGEDDAQA